MSPAVGAAVLPELDPSWAVEPETTNTPSPRVVSDERRHLVVVPEPPKRAARGPFLLLIGGLLVMGLVGLLLLNTALAQGSFQLHDLRIQQAALADQEQALLKKVSAAESPEVLAKKAKAIGMVPSETPVFLRLSDGKVLGKPKAAHKPAPKVVAKKASKKPAATTPTTSTAKPVTTTAAKPATTTSTQKKPAGTTP